MDSTTFAPILHIAHTLGANPTYIQGGGGNISIKIDDTTMLVKASGLCLRDITLDYGFVAVDYQTLRTGLRTIDTHTDLNTLIATSDQLVATCTDPKATLRPSIETGFHALLGPVVFHTHAAYANLLTCSLEGRDIIATLFPTALYIPYNTPGIALTLAIQEALTTAPDTTVLFLENHGVIISGTTAAAVAAEHERINETILHHFELSISQPSYTFASQGDNHTATATALDISTSDLRHFPATILFPDQVVYGEQMNFDPSEPATLTIDADQHSVTCTGSEGFARATFETLTTWNYLFRTIPALGLTLRTLSATEGIFITNLASEQYRKQII